MADKRLTLPGSERTRISYMANQTQKMPVGWCNNNKHRGKLSIKQMKNHKCLQHQCKFFCKNLKHPYWETRAKNKQAKKDAKFKARFSDTIYEEIKKALDNIIPKK